MGMFFALAALALAQPLRYTAKFVDVGRHHVSKNSVICDARSDLSLAGYTYTAMIDVAPAASLAILKGAPQGPDYYSNGSGDGKGYWCFHVERDGSFLALEGVYPSFDRPGHGERFVRVRFRGRKAVVLATVSRWSGRTTNLPFAGVSEFTKVPGWAMAYVKRNSPAGYEDRASLTTCGALGNLTFFPITPGYDTCMHDAESTVAVVRSGSRYVPLSTLIVGGGRYRLEEIVWVSKEGWLVARGTRNDRDGFVWLAPRRT